MSLGSLKTFLKKQKRGCTSTEIIGHYSNGGAMLALKIATMVQSLDYEAMSNEEQDGTRKNNYLTTEFDTEER